MLEWTPQLSAQMSKLNNWFHAAVLDFGSLKRNCCLKLHYFSNHIATIRYCTIY